MIREGASVVYKRTGTLGKVVELAEMDGKVWAKLDSTGLFYDEDFLEMVEENIVEQSPMRGVEEGEERKGEEREVGKEIEKGEVKERAKTLEIKDEGKIDTSGNVCGAG
ncbi:MAG: DUF2098 family protein [Candidatus Methanomethyliales bacterium]|nr:DUF2098 family protein [Candidatus Methanomethylicales archaeon]